MVPRGNSLTILQAGMKYISVLLLNPFDEILSSVP